MNYCYLAVLVIIIIVFKNKYKTLLNPIIIFYSVWVLVIGLHSLHLYGLYSASQQIYNYMFIGLLFFALGYFFICVFKSRYKIIFFTKYKKKELYTLRYHLMYILASICILFFLRNFIISIALLLNGNGIDTIRTMAQDKNSILHSDSSINNFIYNFIVLPSATAIEVIAVVDFWFGKKNKLLFLINIIIIIMRVISDGGRTPLFNFVLYMIGSYLFLRENTKKESENINFNKKKQKNKIKRYMFIGVIFLAGLTFLRSGALALRHLYFYFAMSPYLFDHWANVVDEMGITSYGTASMNGYIFSIFYLIKNCLITSYPDFIKNVYDLLAQTDSSWPIIAEGGIAANAYVSAFWFFYLDGRVIGIIIGMFLYGCLVTSIYLSTKRSKSIKMLSLYLIMSQGLFFSFIRFPFSKIYYSLAILVILLIAYKPLMPRYLTDKV
ncbi:MULTISPECIES: O-antigen polymerase [Clostridium]|uniref:O-antigen polymerase n=1 Tax=Clostridium TaxID=1485 RepID=UPI001FA8685F|nr:MULTISPECIES: O-antigen polymerase [Clostridium]